MSVSPTSGNAPSKTRTVGLLIESSQGSGRALLMGIGRFVRAHPEWSVYWEAEGFEATWPTIKSIPFDGLIVRDGMFNETARELGVPTVVFGHFEDEWSGVLNITSDSETVGRLAAEHLLSRGFRQFAYVGSFSERVHAAPNWSEDRRLAFEARLGEAGFACAAFDNVPWQKQGGRTPEVMARWLGSLPGPVGCMAANDAQANQVAHACRLANLRVPQQVAIIGVDNDELLCAFCNPALSSVALDFERAGYDAAVALDDWMSTGAAPVSQIVASASFVAARQSTDVLAVADEKLARALRYINLQIRKGPLQVDEIARVAGLSRRTLERCFRREIGRSVQDHIRHLRIAEITREVVQTDLPVIKIARSMGFEDVQHFSRYFRATQGMSPLAYRKSHRTAVTNTPESAG